MSKEMRATPGREILDEAAAWFIEFRDGDADPQTRAGFNAWLRRSPDHIQAYLEIAGIWGDLPAAHRNEALDVDELLATLRTHSNVVPLNVASPPESATAAPAPRRPARTRRYAIAAGLVLASVLSLYMWATFKDVYATGIGEQRFVLLADGSTISLNARTRVKVRYTNQERHIDLLDGQALFDVSPDRKRPFVVNSGDARLKAVGTQFDVYRKRGGTVVTVLEGRVEVSSATGSNVAAALVPASVSAGQQTTVTAAVIRAPEKVNVDSATAWTQRRVVFSSTALVEVADEFNRYNTRQLVVAPDLEQVRISGVYSSTDPASLLAFLRLQPGITVIEDNDRIEVVAH